VGDVAVLVDADERNAMAAAPVEALDSRVRSVEFRERALRRAARFAWQTCAEATIAT
jgi:hypothetical protein